MKKINILLVFCLLTNLFVFQSCQKKDSHIEIVSIPELDEKKTNHEWFYFDGNDYQKVTRINQVPPKAFLPWTEAVRISSSNCTENEGYAVVNRCGILCFDNADFFLSKDNNLFSNRTAGNLFFCNETPVFSLYKSTFFNETTKTLNYNNEKSSQYFLVQFDKGAKISYPVINSNNLSSLPNAEVIDFIWDGINWLCCIKSMEDNKTTFEYISFSPTISLLSLSPATAEGNILIKQSSVEEFRIAKSQIDYKHAPERIKLLLAGFSNKTSFTVEVSSVYGTSSTVYLNKKNDEKPLISKAILAESWSAALFEDGTIFFEGALQASHILRGGKPIVIRLPVLPENFVYSHFCISGTTLYAAWEEKLFYQTGRSGFIRIDLEKILDNL